MPYPYGRYEFLLQASGVSQTPADKGRWAPGYVPHILRGVSFLVTTATTAIIAVYKGDIIQNDGTTRGDGDAFTVNIPIIAAGNVIYKPLNVRFTPGQQLILELITASTAGAVQCMIDVERSPDNPTNNSKMVLTL